MRKVSTLVGLTLFALAVPARAQEAAPAAEKAAAPAGDAASTPAIEPPPASATPAQPAGDATAAPAAVDSKAAPPAAKQRKLQLGLSFLPMGRGSYTYSDTFDSTVTSDAFFAYGFALSAGYEVIPHLVVGLAPQVIFNVQPKPSDFYVAAMKEIDLLARVAYVLPVAEGISAYAELLPGYSLIIPADDSAVSKGLVLAFGAGVAMDMGDRYFLNLGGGYQMGFQSQTAGIHQMQMRTKYLRVALGGGMRF
jgi:hypothetical protein